MNASNTQNKNPNQSKPNPNNKNKNRNYKNNNRRKNDSIIRKLESNTHLNRENFFYVRSIRKMTDKLITFIDPCSEIQLLWSPNPSKWNIKEVLAHLIQTNALYLGRLNHILEEREEDLALFDADTEIRKEEFSTYSIERLLREFLSSRKEIDSLCMKTLDEDWLKKSNHPEKGELSFTEVVRFVATHDEMHIDQIFMLLQRHDPWYKEPVQKPEEKTPELEVASETETQSEEQTENE